jgi:hypothetical protein
MFLLPIQLNSFNLSNEEVIIITEGRVSSLSGEKAFLHHEEIVSWSGVRLTESTNWSIVPAPDDR